MGAPGVGGVHFLPGASRSRKGTALGVISMDGSIPRVCDRGQTLAYYLPFPSASSLTKGTSLRWTYLHYFESSVCVCVCVCVSEVRDRNRPTCGWENRGGKSEFILALLLWNSNSQLYVLIRIK